MRFHGGNPNDVGQGLVSIRATRAVARRLGVVATAFCVLALGAASARSADEASAPGDASPPRFRTQSGASDDATPFQRMRATLRGPSAKPADGVKNKPAAATPSKAAESSKAAASTKAAPASDDASMSSNELPADDAADKAAQKDVEEKPAEEKPAEVNSPTEKSGSTSSEPAAKSAAEKQAADKQAAPAGPDHELKDAAEAAAAAKAATQKAASPKGRSGKVTALPSVAAEDLLKAADADDKSAAKAGTSDPPYRSTDDQADKTASTPAAPAVQKSADRPAADAKKPAADRKPAAESTPPADADPKPTDPTPADTKASPASGNKKSTEDDAASVDAPKGSAEKKPADAERKPADGEKKPADEPKSDDKKATEADKRPSDAEKSADKAPASDSPDAAGSLTDKLLRTRQPQRVQPPRVVRMTPALAALRERSRRVLAAYFHQPINTVENTSGEVLSYCLAYGAEAELRYGGAAGNAVNGIGSLCFNYPCGGYQLLKPVGKLPMARMGYGLQSQPGQMLAVLAMASVSADYELRLGNLRGRVADLVEGEKLDCVAGSDLSQRLLGLSFYVADGEKWKNRLGEDWSVERLLTEELDRTPIKNDADAVNQLLALSFAVRRFARSGNALEGHYRRADDFVVRYQNFALSLQNSDGSWHPQFFAMRGGSRDYAGLLRASGYILHWLAYSLPEEKLDDPRVVRAVSYVSGMLEEPYGQWNITASSPREIDGVAHALAALRTYDRRVFKPHDPQRPPADQAAKKRAAATESTQ